MPVIIFYFTCMKPSAVESWHTFPDVMVSRLLHSVLPVLWGASEPAYSIPAHCGRAVWLSHLYYVAFGAPRLHRKPKKCMSRKRGTRSWVSSRHFRNENKRSTKEPSAIPWSLLLPPLHFRSHMFQKSSQSSSMHMFLPFRLRSSNDGTFRPGDIVCMVVRSHQFCAKLRNHCSVRWGSTTRLLFVSH